VRRRKLIGVTENGPQSFSELHQQNHFTTFVCQFTLKTKRWLKALLTSELFKLAKAQIELTSTSPARPFVPSLQFVQQRPVASTQSNGGRLDVGNAMSTLDRGRKPASAKNLALLWLQIPQ
jgi:hypothetical protein